MLNQEIAAAIRTIRSMKALGYEDLADVTVRRSISSLEQAQVNVSVGKLAELAKALDFDFVALITLCVALREDAPPEKIIERASNALAEFSSKGGIVQLRSQLTDGKVTPRSPGKPANARNIAAVKNLRSRGFSQAETSKELGLSKSTVNRYWKIAEKNHE
ncbi:resolvase [Pseudomonas moraviensis]|uniref:resolvase n=1 Tax=Pseudomonas moraviensis TaxID=321662 RepID=UPI002092B8CB|nr:resolvase [Pseudomonas moraviensis]UST68624.1 resolvase [Pseudomonas moraviensis]